MAEGLRLHGLVAADAQGRNEAELVAAALSSAGLRPARGALPALPPRAVRRPAAAGPDRRRPGPAPELLIADEPVSSLDASIRGEILALILKLREEMGLGVLVVTHDLGLAWNIADRIAVMYLGRVVEAGPTEEVLRRRSTPTPRRCCRWCRRSRRSSRWCSPARSPTPPGSRPAAGSTRAALPWPTAPPRRGGRVPDAPLEVLPATPDGHQVVLPPRCLPEPVDDGPAGGAAPRDVRRPGGLGRERDRVLLGEWTCLGRRDDLGLAEPRRVAVVEVLGESVARRRATPTAGSTRRTTCAGTAAPSSSRPSRVRAGCVGGGPCAAPTTRGPMPSTAGCCGRRTPRRARPGRLLAPPGGRGGVGGVRLRAPRPRRRRALDRQRGAAAGATLANYDLGSLVTGRTLTYEVAANWKVVAENYNECYHCGPVHPELCRLVPAFAGGGTGLDWDNGVRTARAPGPSP